MNARSINGVNERVPAWHSRVLVLAGRRKGCIGAVGFVASLVAVQRTPTAFGSASLKGRQDRQPRLLPAAPGTFQPALTSSQTSRPAAPHRLRARSASSKLHRPHRMRRTIREHHLTRRGVLVVLKSLPGKVKIQLIASYSKLAEILTSSATTSMIWSSAHVEASCWYANSNGSSRRLPPACGGPRWNAGSALPSADSGPF